ncbi:ABC transporter permease [Breznakiella homolactica]|uniref:Iron ABC transporter permease n=1 Tax=Breznakiella homolactica TaxID=2798577 RepID=A0A7T7XQ34_9SPIR|nr:iron ABC transporter permease [Breznakiella homolactica]QQO10420.1 iron ABC transporter permease [Breznakiella homolactica]
MIWQKLRAKLDFWHIVTFAALAFFILFLIYPLGTILIQSIRSTATGEWTLKNFAKFFSKSYYYGALFNSFKVTLLVTLLTAVMGSLLAYIMKTVRIRGKQLLNIMIMISILSPPFIGAYSWVVLFGRNGVLTRIMNALFSVQLPGIYGFGGILMVFTLKLAPLIYLYMTGAFNNLDKSLSEAAESLGAGSFKIMVRIILPLVLPTLLASALLVFMRAMADFGTPMLIGEGYKTMPVLIYNEFISEVGGDDGFAAALSVITIVITLVIFIGQKYITNKKAVSSSSMNPMEAKPCGGIKNILAHGFCYFFTLMTIMPQLVVITTSFLKTSGTLFKAEFSLESYAKGFSKMGSSIVNTYVFGIIAIACIVLLGVLVSYVSVKRRNTLNNILDTVSMVPYIIPGSVLGIALLISFNKPPLLLSGTAFIIILAWIIRRLPYTLRSSAAILHQISPSIEEAAVSLGASNIKAFFMVTLPMMLPGVISGALMSWLSVITELSSSILLYTTRTRTLTISIYTEVLHGNNGTAAALSSILTLTTVVTLLIFFKVTGKKELEM